MLMRVRVSFARNPSGPIQGNTGDRVEYLLRTSGTKNSAHYWLGEDTACKMWSTNGIVAVKKYFIVEDPEGHPLCGICHQMMPLPNAPPRREKRPKKHKKAKQKPTTVDYARVAEQMRKKRAATQIAGVSVMSDEFLSTFEWRKIRMVALRKYGPVCQCCGATPANGAVMNVDHIKPRKVFPHLALDVDNLQILCHECNHGKGNWDMTDWRTAPEDYETDLDREASAHLRSIR